MLPESGENPSSLFFAFISSVHNIFVFLLFVIFFLYCSNTIIHTKTGNSGYFYLFFFLLGYFCFLLFLLNSFFLFFFLQHNVSSFCLNLPFFSPFSLIKIQYFIGFHFSVLFLLFSPDINFVVSMSYLDFFSLFPSFLTLLSFQ